MNDVEGWHMSFRDYETWLEAFRQENMQLLTAFDKGKSSQAFIITFKVAKSFTFSKIYITETKKFAGSACSGTYPSVDGSKRIAAVGMFALQPEYRGIGLGMVLFKKLLEHPNVAGSNMVLTGGRRSEMRVVL